ncbi:MAG: SipW-dependent-type signal peptide-containing protein, partial [Lentisphaeria bacterium]|nr:SipW-dependent-type signal peptide-containing protein [Lentisphaeria bacterium]
MRNIILSAAFAVAALVLSVAMATSGTLAYLQDTAEDVNVMTLGSVKIEQHEYERVKNADGTY